MAAGKGWRLRLWPQLCFAMMNLHFLDELAFINCHVDLLWLRGTTAEGGAHQSHVMALGKAPATDTETATATATWFNLFGLVYL